MRARRMASLAGFAALALLALGAGGCFDAPKLEDRWSRVDLLGSNLTPFESVTLGTAESVSVQTTVTYRSILTGYAVAELRASTTLDAGSVEVYPNAARLRMATDIDSILANSVSLGRAIRPVTGWDHLIQRIDLNFGTTLPSVIDSLGTGHSGLFLVCYLGSGEKFELPSGEDSIIVTPFRSSEMHILPIGMELAPAAAPALAAKAGR